MKKLLIGLILMATCSVKAELKKECRAQIEDVYFTFLKIERLQEEGDITEKEAATLVKHTDDLAERVAAGCAVKSRTEIIKAIKNSQGVLAAERLLASSEQIRTQALDYYQRLKQAF